MNALLYAPELPGHPQIYCRVIARALLRAGHTVTIASPTTGFEVPSTWPVLRPLAEEAGIQWIDTRSIMATGQAVLTVEQIVDVQAAHHIDSTLFVEADKSADQFRRIAARNAPRLRGRICGIFSDASAWYPGEDPYTGAREPVIGPTLRRTVGRIKRAIFDRKDSIRHFYEHVLLGCNTVDALIVKDERIARRFGRPISWMPEIYRVFDWREDERRGADWDRFADSVRAHTERAGADNVLLYFGTGAWYKGYDWFLQLALRDECTYAIHAGAPDRQEPQKPYDLDIARARGSLLRQGRLLETSAFIRSGDLIDLLFSSISRFVSTHRLTLSSGTVLQALEMGKPVLTANTGLVGWRTREWGLGSTYGYGDADDLAKVWRRFRTGAMDPSGDGIRQFMRRLSREQTEQYFVDILTEG